MTHQSSPTITGLIAHRPTGYFLPLTQVSKCLKLDPHERPTFAEIAACLDLILGPATSMPQAGHASQDATTVGAAASVGGEGEGVGPLSLHQLSQEEVAASSYHWAHRNALAACLARSREQAATATTTASAAAAAAAAAAASCLARPREEAALPVATATSATAMMTTASSQQPWYNQTTVML